MRSLKILPLLLSLGLALAPQISVAQTVEELEQKATSAEEVKNYEEAANIWRSFIQKDAKNSYAYVKLADVLSKQGKIAETIATYRQALQLTPDGDIYLKLGNFLTEKGRTTEAIATFRQAIKLNPNSNKYYYYTLASQLMELGNTKEALLVYRQIVKLEPDAESYNILGNVWRKLGQREEAIAAHREALKIDPKSYLAYHYLGEMMEYQEAVAIYRQASKNDSKNEVYYEHLASLSLQRGFVNEAIAAYRQLIKIEPEASRYVELADVLMTQEKHQEAIALYRQAVAKKPTDDYYSKLSQALAQQNKLDEALAICQNVVKTGEGSYETCSNINLPLYKQKGFSAVMAFYQPLANMIPRRKMAELYIKLGRDISYGESGDGSKQEAAAVFQEALQIDPENTDAKDALKNLIAN
ncbi:tetratricopeptide repeat protein [Nostoc edaphicum CCNP1411]|uniref:Tetratricopeptide repeat protein n=1 Tax=Nostoc edaphicum CCNP1411 TaxID=1472755 RepID=A0A7D7L9K2_9NOSO|nr:tetratricopeptide repeat protein [Nostoc edaphicum]QMS86568.1 tetratricopeptide repeat protein [Nostoc edaphicum CCNP1411]